MSDLLDGPIYALLLLLFAHACYNLSIGAVDGLNETRIRQGAENGEAEAEKLLPLVSGQDWILHVLGHCTTLNALLLGAITALFVEQPLAEALYNAGLRLPNGLLGVLCVFLTSFLLALIMLVFFADLARQLAEAHPERTARRIAGPVLLLVRIVSPVEHGAECFAGQILRLLGVRKSAPETEVTEDDIMMMVDRGEEQGAIEEDEKEMIENIFAFNNRMAEDVMTHRTDVVAIQLGDSAQEILKTISDTGLSRFPVYDKDMDDIVGVLNARDFLLNHCSPRPRPLKALLRDAYFVPETVQADDLFRDMQKRKTHIAVVVDEYGGLSGIITMEDLLEEIVGNIYDEFDPQAEAEIVRLGDGRWRISGTAALEQISEALGVEIEPDGEYDTLAGLILAHLTTVPADGSKPALEACGLRIQVERVAEHRIESAVVSVIPEPADTPEQPDT